MVPFAYMSSFLPQLPSTVLLKSDVYIPHRHPLLLKVFMSNHFSQRKKKKKTRFLVQCSVSFVKVNQPGKLGSSGHLGSAIS